MSRSGYDHIFEDEELEQVPMAPAKKTDFLEKEVRQDDTLQSIALEFNVSVSTYSLLLPPINLHT